MTRASISAYEENRAEPKMDAALKIANYFNIPIEGMLTHEITVNEFARFNLKNFLGDESKFATVSIPIISARKWEAFLNKESMDDFPSFNCPKHFIQGEIAIEVNEKINTDLHTGTILLCTEQESVSDTGAYLVINKNMGFIHNGHQIKKSKGLRYYRIFQKIEEINSISSGSLEERLDTLEKQIQKLMKK